MKTTFGKAFDSRNRPEGLMFHSDQGFQYTAFELRKYLRELKVNQSFSNAGTPLDNAVAESFFACMKREELSHNFYDTGEQLERDVSEFVHYFNCERPHQKLGFRTPEQVEKEYLMINKKTVFGTFSFECSQYRQHIKWWSIRALLMLKFFPQLRHKQGVLS